MLEKIKAFAESVKSVLLYILGPIAFVAGIIYYYVTKTHTLEDELKAKDGQEKLNELKGEQKSTDSAAVESNESYTAVRDRYKQEHKDDL